MLGSYHYLKALLVLSIQLNASCTAAQQQKNLVFKIVAETISRSINQEAGAFVRLFCSLSKYLYCHKDGFSFF